MTNPNWKPTAGQRKRIYELAMTDALNAINSGGWPYSIADEIGAPHDEVVTWIRDEIERKWRSR